MLEREERSLFVVHRDVGHTPHPSMARDRHYGDGKPSHDGGIDQNDALDGAINQQARIFLDEILLAPMAGDEVEVAFPKQVIFDPRHDGGGVALADLGREDTDQESALETERACEEVWPI